MPYLWQLLHPNCSLLGCCFLASSHFLSISLPTSRATSERQRSASVGLRRELLPWHGWRGFPEPAGVCALLSSACSEPWGAERGCKYPGFAPCSCTLGTAGWPAQLGWVFPTHSRSPLCQLLGNQGIAFARRNSRCVCECHRGDPGQPPAPACARQDRNDLCSLKRFWALPLLLNLFIGSCSSLPGNSL